MTAAGRLGGAAAVSNTVYYIGGRDSASATCNFNYAYDTVANTWSSKTVLPTATEGQIVVTSGTLIFSIGGYTTGYTDANRCYDTVANTWSTKAVMPAAMYEGAGAIVSGYIYFIGGTNSGGTAQTSNYQYKV